MLMQNNSDTTRTHNPILQAYVRVRLTNVLIDNVGLKQTIYYYHLTHLLQNTYLVNTYCCCCRLGSQPKYNSK